MSSPLRIAIIGGGIGGLTCAIALKQAKDVEVDIYESTPTLGAIGAGITMWPRTWKVLSCMEMDSKFRAILNAEVGPGKENLAFELRKSDQREGVVLSRLYGDFMQFLRADIHRILLESIPNSTRIHLSHRLVAYEVEKSQVSLKFANGHETECDVLLGADGIKSIVRTSNPHFFGEGSTCPKVYNLAYRGLVSSEQLLQILPDHRAVKHAVQYLGKNKHIIAYPVSQSQKVNVVAYFSDEVIPGQPWDGPSVSAAEKEDVLAKFAGWEPEVLSLLQCIESPTCWAIQAIEPLSSYVSPRVALLGDAAHAMTPHLGAGAMQAIEDACILGTILSNTSRASIPDALQLYNSIRQPYANKMLQGSHKQGLTTELNIPGWEQIEEGAQLDEGTCKEWGRLVTESFHFRDTGDEFISDYNRAREWNR